VLFESAACVFGARLLAILLTGASTDGSEGVAAVRAVGGNVWIQDPADATAPLMPAAAIAHAGADAVLTLEQICLALENTNT
jgi:two-component system chemotaxis response regulator CheB